MHEVTRAEVAAWRRNTIPEWSGGRWGVDDANLPTVLVTQPDAAAYCAAISARLPTREEWRALIASHHARRVRPGPALTAVGSNPADRVDASGRVYDLVGSVREWTSTPGPGGVGAVAMGGHFGLDGHALRESLERGEVVSGPMPQVGFRCVR